MHEKEDESSCKKSQFFLALFTKFIIQVRYYVNKHLLFHDDVNQISNKFEIINKSIDATFAIIISNEIEIKKSGK